MHLAQVEEKATRSWKEISSERRIRSTISLGKDSIEASVILAKTNSLQFFLKLETESVFMNFRNLRARNLIGFKTVSVSSLLYTHGQFDFPAGRRSFAALDSTIHPWTSRALTFFFFALLCLWKLLLLKSLCVNWWLGDRWSSYRSSPQPNHPSMDESGFNLLCFVIW